MQISVGHENLLDSVLCLLCRGQGLENLLERINLARKVHSLHLLLLVEL